MMEAIEIDAKALWDRHPHAFLKRGGKPTEWDKQPRALKNQYRADARAVVKAYEGAR